ncbi:MAG: amidohydrolase family protein [Phycisphaeraceae bacterium]|nr:amidohydrolase family protein [Phycisphaeraceae bacterium]
MSARPDTFTIAGTLMVPHGAEGVRLVEGTLFVREGRVEGMREGPPAAAPDMGGEGWLVLPGLADCHLHLPQFDSIGADGLELLDWLESVIFPAEMRWADTDFAREMSLRAARELLSFGTTAVGAYATVHHEGTQAAIDALASLGMRGVVGQVLMDQNAPGDLLVPASAALSQAMALRGCGGVMPAVTPRFAVSCSEKLLRGAGELAAKTGWMIQTHLAETERECDFVRAIHGASYVEVYRAAGLLTPGTLLGHGIHLDERDLSTLAASGAGIAHCPTANTFLNAGEFRLAATLHAGVGVCVGSDVGAGPDRSMVRVARAMLETAKRVALKDASTPPTASWCWWRITGGNAAALGIAQGGTLVAGAPADLVLVLPTTDAWTRAADALSALLYSWDDRWIKATLTGGRRVFEA